MGNWKKVKRCLECGKIYENGIPSVCKKCGTILGTKNMLIQLILGSDYLIQTDSCETVIARRRLYGWQIRKAVTHENIHREPYHIRKKV